MLFRNIELCMWPQQAWAWAFQIQSRQINDRHHQQRPAAVYRSITSRSYRFGWVVALVLTALWGGLLMSNDLTASWCVLPFLFEESCVEINQKAKGLQSVVWITPGSQCVPSAAAPLRGCCLGLDLSCKVDMFWCRWVKQQRDATELLPKRQTIFQRSPFKESVLEWLLIFRTSEMRKVRAHEKYILLSFYMSLIHPIHSSQTIHDLTQGKPGGPFSAQLSTVFLYQPDLLIFK